MYYSMKTCTVCVKCIVSCYLGARVTLEATPRDACNLACTSFTLIFPPRTEIPQSTVMNHTEQWFVRKLSKEKEEKRQRKRTGSKHPTVDIRIFKR